MVLSLLGITTHCRHDYHSFRRPTTLDCRSRRASPLGSSVVTRRSVRGVASHPREHSGARHGDTCRHLRSESHLGPCRTTVHARVGRVGSDPGRSERQRRHPPHLLDADARKICGSKLGSGRPWSVWLDPTKGETSDFIAKLREIEVAIRYKGLFASRAGRWRWLFYGCVACWVPVHLLTFATVLPAATRFTDALWFSSALLLAGLALIGLRFERWSSPPTHLAARLESPAVKDTTAC
jgi:hypothetical protein